MRADYAGAACYRGRLYRIGDYPGAVPSDDPGHLVHGEVYLLHDAKATLPWLDSYEEFGPTFAEPNEFVRQKQPVLLGNGVWISAWIYLYNRAAAGLELIESGSFPDPRAALIPSSEFQECDGALQPAHRTNLTL